MKGNGQKLELGTHDRPGCVFSFYSLIMSHNNEKKKKEEEEEEEENERKKREI